MRKENGFWSNSAALPRTYSADDFMDYFRDFFTDGVLGDDSTKLFVSASDGMQVNVSEGTAYADGHFFAPTSAASLELSPSDTSYGRIDLICVRVDYEQKDVYLHVEEGLPNVTPETPSITRNGEYYDLGIATINVGAGVTSITQADITDLRFDTAYCGQVVGKIKTINTSALFAQYQAAWNAFVKQLGESDNVTINTADEYARRKINDMALMSRFTELSKLI